MRANCQQHFEYAIFWLIVGGVIKHFICVFTWFDLVATTAIREGIEGKGGSTYKW
jgi:hypothetical protein